jgi:hypothetical protein
MVSAGFAETGSELTALRETVTAGFARVDRYFELQQVQFIEFRDEVSAGSMNSQRVSTASSERYNRCATSSPRSATG